MPLPGSEFNPGGSGYGSGIGMGGYGTPQGQQGYSRMDMPMTDPRTGITSTTPMWLDPAYQNQLAGSQAEIQARQAMVKQHDLANMFRQALMQLLFGGGQGGGRGGMGGQGGQGGMLPGLLAGSNGVSSPFNPSFGRPGGALYPALAALMQSPLMNQQAQQQERSRQNAEQAGLQAGLQYERSRGY